MGDARILERRMMGRCPGRVEDRSKSAPHNAESGAIFLCLMKHMGRDCWAVHGNLEACSLPSRKLCGGSLVRVPGPFRGARDEMHWSYGSVSTNTGSEIHR